MQTHTNGANEEIPQRICPTYKSTHDVRCEKNKRFPHRTHRKEQRQKDKPEILTYTCPTCAKTFAAKGQLNIHRPQYTEREQYSYNLGKKGEIDRSRTICHGAPTHEAQKLLHGLTRWGVSKWKRHLCDAEENPQGGSKFAQHATEAQETKRDTYRPATITPPGKTIWGEAIRTLQEQNP